MILAIKCVIFDMDGLIFDSEKLWVKSAIKINETFHYGIPNNIFKKCVGCGDGIFETQILTKMGNQFNINEFLHLTDIMMNREITIHGLKVKDGFIELINVLRSLNMSLALASSSPLSRIRKYFKTTGMSEDIFDVIVSGDNVIKAKPDPEIYIKTLRLLNISPSEAYVFEDSENGVKAAVGAGIRTILIPDLNSPNQKIAKLAFKKYDNLLQAVELFA